MKLPEFIKQLRSDVDKFAVFYQAGLDGPDNYYEGMDAADWYEQFEAWLSMQDPV